MIELKFDNEDKLYHKKELNYVDESFKYEINDNITKYSKSFKLNFNIKREIQLIALLINQNITYEIFEENMKDLLKDCDILIFELMKAIKLIIDDPSINNELVRYIISYTQLLLFLTSTTIFYRLLKLYKYIDQKNLNH